MITALIGTAGVALAQGVTSAIAPQASAPAGCSASYDGTFEITVAKVAGAEKRNAPIAVSSPPNPPPPDQIFMATVHLLLNTRMGPFPPLTTSAETRHLLHRRHPRRQAGLGRADRLAGPDWVHC